VNSQAHAVEASPADAYGARYPASAALMERAQAVMPGGNTRTTAYYPPFPLAIARADGPYLWDADGNQLIDLLMNYTSLVHGHRFPPAMEAARQTLERGTAWPAPSEEQVQLAELLCTRIPSLDQVRFCNSGTEAGMLAVRIARRATGRRKLLMASQGYHGSYSELEAGGGPDTLDASYGDLGAFRSAIEAHASDLAAVVVEPALAGVITPPSGFLEGVAAAARDAGAVLVLDEVVTLRHGVGGAQESAGIRPDLTMMGKLIGGGFPVGAVGGRAGLMSLLDPSRPDALGHSGTFNGNPITCAAGHATTVALTAEAIERASGQTAQLAEMLEQSAARHGVPFSVTRRGTLLNVYMSEQPQMLRAERSDGALIGAFHLLALQHGIFFAPRGLIAVATIVDDPLLEEIGRRFDAAFADAARLG
jgi:glutamate-1-semialdehyde 2,1-aminomutase